MTSSRDDTQDCFIFGCMLLFLLALCRVKICKFGNLPAIATVFAPMASAFAKSADTQSPPVIMTGILQRTESRYFFCTIERIDGGKISAIVFPPADSVIGLRYSTVVGLCSFEHMMNWWQIQIESIMSYEGHRFSIIIDRLYKKEV